LACRYGIAARPPAAGRAASLPHANRRSGRRH